MRGDTLENNKAEKVLDAEGTHMSGGSFQGRTRTIARNSEKIHSGSIGGT